MPRPLVAVLAAALLALLTACGTQQAGARPPEEDQPRPASSTSSPAAPGALRPGQVKTLDTPTVDSTVTVYSAARLRSTTPARKGHVYVGVQARVCIISLGPDDQRPVSVSWRPWTLRLADDSVAEPLEEWSQDQFGVRLIPGHGTEVAAGQCVRGAIPFEVPTDTTAGTAVYTPRGAEGEALTPIEWKVR